MNIFKDKSFVKKLNSDLKNGAVICFVTDTVWGIGALPTSKEGVEKIYTSKKRDPNKPLILMSNDIKNLLPSDVEIIKIGHHGAKNSINNEMIKQLKPKYALISAGHKFNHPHIDVVEILDKNNVKMISTKNYGFSKIVLKDNFEKIYYFDNFKNTLREIHFKNSESLPFYKSDFMNEIIQKATKNH